MMLMIVHKGKTFTHPLPHSNAKGCTTGFQDYPKYSGTEAIAMSGGLPVLCGDMKHSNKCHKFKGKTKEWIPFGASLNISRKSAVTVQLNENDFLVMGKLILTI